MPFPLQPPPIPPFFKCPISLELMLDPVSLCTGVTYDRSSIQTWLDSGHNTCPATMRPLQNQTLTPNHTLKRLIQQWCNANPSHGAQSQATAPAPAKPEEMCSMLQDVSGNRRLAALQRLRVLAKENHRNRTCMETAGAVGVLVDLIRSESLKSDPEAIEIMQEAVGLLVLFSIDDARRQMLLGTSSYLRLISRLLLRGNVEARVNAAQLLETLATDRCGKVKIGGEEGIVSGLLALLKESLYPTAVKAGLKTLLSLSQTLRNRAKIVDMGVVPTLVELLPGAERAMAERVMALLDVLSACVEGRAAISKHALAIAGVVKCLLVVSESTTEHAVGVLWSVCLHTSDEELLRETIQLGTFKTLLLLMQMDCNPTTKQKAKDLLRLFADISGDNLCTSSEEI